MNAKTKLRRNMLVLIIMIFGLWGCLNNQKEEFDLNLNITSDKQVESSAENILVTINTNAETVKINGNEREMDGRTQIIEKVTLHPGENKILIQASKGNEKIEKELKVFKEFKIGDTTSGEIIYSKKGRIIYPVNGQLFVGENGTEDFPQKAQKRDITDPIDETVQGGKALSTLTAVYDHTSNAEFSDGDKVGIYVFINNVAVDYILGDAVDASSGIDESGANDGQIDLPIAGDYILKEGKNEISLLLVNETNKSANSVYLGADSTNPTTVTVDATNPDLNLIYPVNNSKLNFTSAAGAYGAVRLELEALDSYDVTLYAALVLDDGATTPAQMLTSNTSIGDITIHRDGSTINPAKSISLSKDDLTTSIYVDNNPTVSSEFSGTTGTIWYLYVLAVDANADTTPSSNYTFIKRKISGADVGTTISLATNLKIKENGVTRPYISGMEINSNHIEFLYTDSIDKNGIVKITKYEANESVAAYSKTLTHEIESSLYTGDYSLSDFGYETLASNDQPINLFIEMTDQALNSEKKALVFNYVDTEITAEGLVILDDDITLFDGDGFTVLSKNKVIDSEEGKIYFDLDPNGGIATKIFSVEIVNPNGYDYKIKIGDTTKQDFDSGSSTQWNISEDITLTPSSPTEVIKIYLGDTVIKELELIGLVDYGDINEDGTLTDTKITVDEVIIYQNKDEVKITGEVEMPTTLVDEYVIQAQFTNNTGNTTSWMNLNDITNINSNKIDFSGTIEYDYDSAAAGDFDMLNIRVYSQLFSTEPTGTVINLDGTNNDDNLNLAAIQVESVLDTDTIWKIGTDEQTIDITNGTSFSLVELYLNGVLNDTQIIPNASGTDDFPTTGTYVDFNNINTIKIVGTNTNVSKVKLEREIAITRASALETPDFITIPKDGEIYTSDFVISGEVNNATKVELVSVKQNGSEISWESGNLPLALTLINGNFYSDNLTDDDLYTTGGAGAGTYTDFANGEGIIEGQEYTAIIRATQENGASTEYEFIGKYDTLAPTEYHENGATKANGGGGYSKFNDNSNTEWIMDTLYFNDSGELIYESGDNSGAGYTEGDLYPNKDELDEAGSDYTIATIGGGYDFDIDTITDTIDIDQGYMALIKNQKGYNDYLIAYIPISESDGDYGTINSEENITVVITDKNGNNLLRKMIRQGATGTDREIFLDLGDNKIEEINVYLQDEHLNKTGEYKFENSLYLAMSAMDVEARIYEGASEGNELKDLRMSQISNTTEMDIALYTTSIDPLNLITNIPNVDVSNAEYSLLLSGNINTGDTLILQATDIYGNNIFEEDRTGYISTTVKDYLPPSLPTATDIIVENKNYPDNNEKDIITGKIEPNAVVILRDENNYELIRTDTDTNGEFSMSLNGDSHSVIKMEIIDESGNSTVDSLLHDNYFAITSKFAQSYNYAVQNLVSVGNSFGIGDGIDLSWTNVSQSPEDIAMGNILKSNKIKFLWGTESVEKVVSTNSETINPEDIGIFDLSTVTIEVYPKSELGFECNSSPSIQISVDTRAPTSAAIDLNEITASVKNDEINVTANALDEAVAGKGSGDILYLGINNIYKEWTGAVLKYTSAEIGTINNSTTFDVKVKDKTGNESSALTLSATDDEAPEISDLRVVEGISTSTRDGVDFLQFKIKHKTEDDVIVYAYDNNTVTNGEPNGTLLGILSLGALDTEILMNVRGADAANVYIFVSDTDKNYSSAVKLNTIVEE